jgi:hypothetical protein
MDCVRQQVVKTAAPRKAAGTMPQEGAVPAREGTS